MTATPASAIGMIDVEPPLPGVGADPARPATAAPRPAPQPAQNLAPGALALPQAAQDGLPSAAPQCEQNLPEAWVPQEGQRTDMRLNSWWNKAGRNLPAGRAAYK